MLVAPPTISVSKAGSANSSASIERPTEFWGKAGKPVEHLPTQSLMSAEDLVDAALAGLDQCELVTIPSLPDAYDCRRLEAARRELGPNLSHAVPTARYGINHRAAA